MTSTCSHPIVHFRLILDLRVGLRREWRRGRRPEELP